MADSENTFSDEVPAPVSEPVAEPEIAPLPEDVLQYKSSGLSRVFASGDKRLLQCINNGNCAIHPIHSQYEDMNGLNFLGNLTNIKQHIQFIKYLRGECDIPKNLLHLFLKGYDVDRYYHEMGIIDFDSPTKESLLNLQFYFDKCEAYIFQITSLDIAEKDGYQILNDIHCNDIKQYKQTAEDFENDIKTLISMIPAGRKIIFANDFYPDLVLNGSSKNPDLETITKLLGTASNNSEYNTHSIRFLDYNKFKETPFFSQLFEENSTKFTLIGLGFAFIMLNEYFIKPS